MNRKTGKLDIHAVLMRIVCVLQMLVLVSTSIVSGQLARYVTRATGTDSARVARFEVTQAGTLMQSFSQSISPGEQFTRSVEVVNASEVAVDYIITVSNPENNLPLEFSAVDSNGDSLTLAVSGNTSTLTGFMPENDATPETFILTVKWKDGVTDDSYAGKVDLIRITLTAAQAD